MVLYLRPLLTIHVLLYLSETATASVNLWVSKTEAKSLLGKYETGFRVRWLRS